MTDLTGEIFGNYRLVRQIGNGGFADVYLGEHIHLKSEAAVKVLHLSLSEKGIEEFRTEGQRLARLIHPNIVRVLDFDIRPGSAHTPNIHVSGVLPITAVPGARARPDTAGRSAAPPAASGSPGRA